jgi:hypothetical protein
VVATSNMRNAAMESTSAPVPHVEYQPTLPSGRLFAVFLSAPGGIEPEANYVSLRGTGVDVVMGHFFQKKRVKPVGSDELHLAEVVEEKGTDVNVGVDLVRDALTGQMDSALVVCNDSDLPRAADIAILHVEVVVSNPHHGKGKGWQRRRPSLVGDDVTAQDDQLAASALERGLGGGL